MFIFFHNWVNKLFSVGNKVPRTLFEARKVAGSATCKQSKTVLNCVVLWGHFVYVVMETKIVCLFSLFNVKVYVYVKC